MILNRDASDIDDYLKDAATLITAATIPVALHWPKTCHSLHDRKFQKYLINLLKAKGLKEGSRFPPDSKERGKEWNTKDYLDYLKDIAMVDLSRIDKKGLFLNEGYQLALGDLILYSGKVHFGTSEDGFDLQVDLFPNADEKKESGNYHKVIEPFNHKKNKDKKKEGAKDQERKGNISLSYFFLGRFLLKPP